MTNETIRLRSEVAVLLGVLNGKTLSKDEQRVSDYAYRILQESMSVPTSRVKAIIKAVADGCLRSIFETSMLFFDCDCEGDEFICMAEKRNEECPNCGAEDDCDHPDTRDFEVWLKFPYYTMEYIHTGDKHLTRSEFAQWEREQAIKQKKSDKIIRAGQIKNLDSELAHLKFRVTDAQNQLQHLKDK